MCVCLCMCVTRNALTTDGTPLHWIDVIHMGLTNLPTFARNHERPHEMEALSSPNHCTATKVHHQVLRSCQHPHEQGVEESVCVRVCPSVRARTHTQQQQWSTREGVLLYCLHNTGLEGVLLYCLHNTGLEGVLLYCLHNRVGRGTPLLPPQHRVGRGSPLYQLHNTGLEGVLLYTSSTTQGWKR